MSTTAFNQYGFGFVAYRRKQDCGSLSIPSDYGETAVAIKLRRQHSA
jgi:hypothetical protein